MNEVLTSLVDMLDLQESKTIKTFSWKPEFDQIMVEAAAVNASVESHAAKTGNPLFTLLAKQNVVLMGLVLVLIAGQSK